MVFASVMCLAGLACCGCLYSRRSKSAQRNEALRSSLDLVVSTERWHQAPSAMVPYNPLRRTQSQQVGLTRALTPIWLRGVLRFSARAPL